MTLIKSLAPETRYHASISMRHIVNELSWVLIIFGACDALGAAPPKPVSLETPFLRFSITPENGTFQIIDKAAAVTWRSSPYHARFGEVTVNLNGKPQRLGLEQCEVTKIPTGLDLRFRPLPNDPGAVISVTVRTNADERTLEFNYALGVGVAVESVRLLDDALWVTDAEEGYLVVPVREGMLIPATSGLSFTHRFDTFAYEGCHMEMLGVVKQGAAALLTWHDPYVAAESRSVLTNAVWVHGQQVLSPSLVLRQSAKSFKLHFLGRGDYATIAQAYRQVANDKGWLTTWDDKLQGHPERARLFGAINFKLWSALDRRMDETSTKEERVTVNWTFDEAAQVAEHLKRDLQLDKVLFTMGGWIHRGYDNQHPDVLPTAAELGGDQAFADCARRVREAGYLFCLHDNYQDMYRDAPSWNEAFIMRSGDGSLTRGGHWAGGLAYLTCSQKALELARRPQNLPTVKMLSEADAYFIDTTYAAGLMECRDPNHPLTRGDDMHYKQALSDYARDVFGIFGSECGREWAIPHSDFFEGLTGVSGRSYHDAGLLTKVGGQVVPLFEMVYRDCIALYGKYGYDIAQSAEYVLRHLIIGRPLNYHSVPAHLYWREPNRASGLLVGKSPGDRAVFTRAQHGWAEGLHPFDRFVKNTAEILSPLNELTACVPLTVHQFVTPDRKVQRSVFGSGPDCTEVIVNLSEYQFRCHRRGDSHEVLLPPYGFLVDSPQFVAFHALEWGGLKYDAATMFTLRSLDSKPLETSSRVRVFHGFGNNRVQWANREHTVDREAVVSLQ